MAALRFYERAGFQICTAFGAYTTRAPHAIATSVFMQKQLAAPPADPQFASGYLSRFSRS
jgi:hypothetical protein